MTFDRYLLSHPTIAPSQSKFVITRLFCNGGKFKGQFCFKVKLLRSFQGCEVNVSVRSRSLERKWVKVIQRSQSQFCFKVTRSTSSQGHKVKVIPRSQGQGRSKVRGKGRFKVTGLSSLQDYEI